MTSSRMLKDMLNKHFLDAIAKGDESNDWKQHLTCIDYLDEFIEKNPQYGEKILNVLLEARERGQLAVMGDLHKILLQFLPKDHLEQLGLFGAHGHAPEPVINPINPEPGHPRLTK